MYHKKDIHKSSTKNIQEAREHGHKHQVIVLADFQNTKVGIKRQDNKETIANKKREVAVKNDIE